jgi:hypothetical protein
MAYLLLENSLLWDAAHELCQCSELCFVGVQQHRYHGEREVKPIEARVRIKNYWYNYHHDNTYLRSQVEKDGKEVAGYGLYMHIPDTIAYYDLLTFCREKLLPLKGFRTYVLYKTDYNSEFMFSFERGKFLIDVEIPFAANPFFHFVYGTPREKKYDPAKYQRMRARQGAGIIGKPGRPRKGSTHIAEETVAAKNVKRRMGRPRIDPNAPRQLAAPFIPPRIVIIDDDCD